MSKKQQTLLQSWANGTKLKTTPKKVGGNKNPLEVSLIDSDEDDELLSKALEESLKQYQLSNQANVESFVPQSNGPSTSTAPPSATSIESLPGFDNEAGSTWIYPTNYSIRKYQRDIVETCLFYNTLVSLPTGLGKTFIAAVVMYNFFRWYPEGKVIFLAPTKPLVAQQIEACYNITGIPLETSSEMTGALAPEARKKEWKEKRVFFLTPQVIANDISRGTCPVSNVKCLVLDEAHKALGNYAYVQVVNELTKHGAVFRILALSATPGSDLKAIQQVISNLQICRIEMRNEESPDILPYIHSRIVDKIVVPLGPEVSAVRDTFLHILGSVARRLMQQNLLFTKDIGSLNRNAVLRAREIFRQNPPTSFPKAKAGMVEGDFALCITLTHALELLQLHGIRGFYNFLAGKTDPVSEGGQDGAHHNRTRTEMQKIPEFRRMMDELKPKITANYISHPKLQKLLDIVLEHFRRCEEEKKTTRVMIFSQYRDSVEEIASLFTKHEPLIKAMSFVGHGSGKSKVKFTQADQLRVVKQFRDGNYNTLVATCVGEEGLDIGDVDLIVCYDAHKSPVRLVQRMGRTGRKRDGRIVMLMTEGKEEHVYNASVYQKKNLLKNIVQGDKLKNHLSTNSPRMVPRHIQPRCHEMPMTVQQKYPVANPRRRDSTSSNSLRKGKTTKSYYLSDAEYDYYVQNFKPDQPVAALPRCYDPLGTSDSELKLDQWIPWQCTLQPTHTVGHSSVTHNFVEMLELISVQQDASASFHYDKEMKAHLNLGDVSLPFDRPGSSADYLPPDECRADAEVLDIFSHNFDISLDPMEKYNESRAWDHRGLFSPTFLQLFNHQCSMNNDQSIRAPLDFPSPPPANFHLSSDNSSQDGEMDLSVFPSCRIRPNKECVKSQFGEILISKASKQPFNPLPDESALSTSFMPEANFDVDFDAEPFVSSPLYEAPFSFGKSLPLPEKLPTSPRLVAEIDESNLKQPDSASPDDPIHVLHPEERVEPSPPPHLPVANFDVDLDLSDFGDDIIPQTPPRAKETKKCKTANEPLLAKSTSQLKTPPRATNEIEWEADPSPILSQRRRKSLKRKLELVCSTPAVAVKDEKRVRVENSDCDENDNDVEIPASQNFWKEFESNRVKIEDDVQTVKSEPEFSRPASADNLLSVSQIVHFINSNPFSEGEGETKVKCEPLPHGNDNEAIGVSVSPQMVQANFDIELDFLERSPAVACKKSSNALQQEVATPVKRPIPPIQQSPPPKGVDHKSVWDDGFELSWDEIEEIEAVEAAAVGAVPKESIRPLDMDDDVIVESASGSSMASRVAARSAVAVRDTSALSESTAPGNRSTTRKCGVSSIPKIEVIDLDEEDADFNVTPSKNQLAELSDDEESPMVARCKAKSRRNQFLMTQSTPKMAAASPGEVTKKSRRARNAACSFIEEEASVSSDVTCSEDEDDEHVLKDHYEPSFVDDLMATQHDTDEMRAVYLRSIKSPVAHQGFVFRRPREQKKMNYSDIYSQPNVEQDSDYQLDSFCVDNDEIEHFEETALSQMEPHLLEPEPDAAKAKSKTGRGRKRIIAPSDSTDSEESPPKMPSAAPTTSADPTVASAASSKVARPLIVSTSSSSALSTPSPVIQRSGISSFDLSREERLRKQKEKQEEFRRSRISMAAASGGHSSGSNSSSVVSVSEPLPPRPAQLASALTNRMTSTASLILVSSRQVAVCSEIISSLRVQYHCMLHVCSFDVADFVLSPQMGVVRKLHSDFANGAQRAKLQEQIKSLMADYERPVVIVEADKPARDQWHRGPTPSATGADSNSVIFKSSPPYLYLTQAALAQTNVMLINTTTQQETARVLSDLAKREVSKGFALPDVEKLSAHQKKLFEFLQRIPPLNPAAALLMATRFSSLREIATSSSEMISRKCQITAGQARNVHHAFRIRLPRS